MTNVESTARDALVARGLADHLDYFRNQMSDTKISGRNTILFNIFKDIFSVSQCNLDQYANLIQLAEIDELLEQYQKKKNEHLQAQRQMTELMKKQKTAMAHHFKKTFTKVEQGKKPDVRRAPTKQAFSAIREEDQAQRHWQPQPRQEEKKDFDVNSSHDLSDEGSDHFGQPTVGALDTSGPSSANPRALDDQTFSEGGTPGGGRVSAE